MNKKTILIAAALGLCLPMASQADGPLYTPLQKVFKDWQVTCNNVNDCDVRNMDEELRIIIERKAGEKGDVMLAFQALADGDPQGFWLDGKKVPTDINFSKTSGDDFTVASSDDLATVQRWVQATKNARTLSLSPSGHTVSLSGLNAALLLVDERQERLNNQTALLRVGNREPSTVLPRTPLPVISLPVPKVVELSNGQALIDGVIKTNAALLDKESCLPDKESRERSEVQPLNDRQALVMINCGLGAYQSSSMLFISERDDVTQSTSLTLPVPGENNKPEILTWFTEVDYEPKTGILSFAGRGRGLADCGHSGSWKYDGKAFHLTSYNNQPSCNGGEPGDWPSLWITTVKAD